MGTGGFLFAESYCPLPLQSWTGRNACPTRRSFVRWGRACRALYASVPMAIASPFTSCHLAGTECTESVALHHRPTSVKLLIPITGIF